MQKYSKESGSGIQNKTIGKLILASASPRRKELLTQAGLEFECIPSTIEEIITKKNPKAVVRELAYTKALDVAGSFNDDATIIGADTVVVFKGEIMGKPKDTDDAVRMLKKLQGKKQYVYTGVAILKKNKNKIKKKVFVSKTVVYMKPISNLWISEYVKSGEPMDKAGAYAIQGKADVQIKKIKGSYNNVVGLPIEKVLKVLGIK